MKLLGDAQAAAPDPAEPARASYERALALATALGTRPLAAHCHFALARLNAATGRGEEGAAHLATATALYREMGMPYWLGCALGASAAAAATATTPDCRLS